MIGDELAKDLDALIAEAKAQPPVTAPTPERRVGEADVKVWAEEAAILGTSRQARWLNQRNEIARDLLDERAAVARLTAEVERLNVEVDFYRALQRTDNSQVIAALTAEVERLTNALVKVRAHTAHTKANPDELHIGLLASIERIADAALSLPTPAPEATE